jgi:hypothetical protein
MLSLILFNGDCWSSELQKSIVHRLQCILRYAAPPSSLRLRKISLSSHAFRRGPLDGIFYMTSEDPILNLSAVKSLRRIHSRCP